MIHKGKTMKLAFVKMQGAGNDFVVIDAVRQSFEPTARLMAHIGDQIGRAHV